MRINVHAHIFNFRSVFTSKTVQILLNRLGSDGWPPFIVKAAESALTRLIKGEYLDEQALLSELIGQLNASGAFKEWLDHLGETLTTEVAFLAHGDVDGLAVAELRQLLKRLGDTLSRDNDVAQSNLSDFLGFLLIGFKPSIAEVADILLQASGPDTVSTALMMDITTGDGSDENLFTRQTEDTARAALSHPGRILPFFAVNPRRPSHYTRMVDALEARGFVGVKLYPSLGYSVISPEMEKVFAYCEAHEVPVLVHCNNAGFAADRASVQFCDPAHWDAVLQVHPGLRVCFGHFGGDENLVKPIIPAPSWTATIVRLMQTYPHVYADISYHTACMDGGELQENYFANLATLLAAPRTQDRLLFGSDFLLVRQRLKEQNVWSYFEARFTAEDWSQLTQINPARFLGLTGGTGGGLAEVAETANPDGGPCANIRSHLSWLVAHSQEVGAAPAPWVSEVLEATGIGQSIDWRINPFGTRWTENNDAHYYAAYWLSPKLAPALSTGGDFLRLGSRHVRDLLDYPRESLTAARRDAECRALAASLYVDMIEAYGASLEPGVTQAQAKSRLACLFSDGNTPLHEFGPVVDNLFAFEREKLPT